jgi:hypothetical protein
MISLVRISGLRTDIPGITNSVSVHVTSAADPFFVGVLARQLVCIGQQGTVVDIITNTISVIVARAHSAIVSAPVCHQRTRIAPIPQTISVPVPLVYIGVVRAVVDYVEDVVPVAVHPVLLQDTSSAYRLAFPAELVWVRNLRAIVAGVADPVPIHVRLLLVGTEGAIVVHVHGRVGVCIHEAAAAWNERAGVRPIGLAIAIEVAMAAIAAAVQILIQLARIGDERAIVVHVADPISVQVIGTGITHPVAVRVQLFWIGDPRAAVAQIPISVAIHVELPRIQMGGTLVLHSGHPVLIWVLPLRARVSHPVCVPIGLVRIRDRGTVVSHVGHAVPITVEQSGAGLAPLPNSVVIEVPLRRVGHEWAIVLAVHDTVAVPIIFRQKIEAGAAVAHTILVAIHLVDIGGQRTTVTRIGHPVAVGVNLETIGHLGTAIQEVPDPVSVCVGQQPQLAGVPLPIPVSIRLQTVWHSRARVTRVTPPIQVRVRLPRVRRERAIVLRVRHLVGVLVSPGLSLGLITPARVLRGVRGPWTYVTRIADSIKVAIKVRKVRQQRAPVADITAPISILVYLIGVRHPRTIVISVRHAVSVSVRAREDVGPVRWDIFASFCVGRDVAGVPASVRGCRTEHTSPRFAQLARTAVLVHSAHRRGSPSFVRGATAAHEQRQSPDHWPFSPKIQRHSASLRPSKNLRRSPAARSSAWPLSLSDPARAGHLSFRACRNG